jgi:hypothetical protein
MRSPFKFSNDTKELVAMVLDSTPEVNSVFDRVDKFVLEETTNLDNFLEVINHLHSAQTSYPFSLIRKRGLWRVIRKHDWNMQSLYANQFVFSNASPNWILVELEFSNPPEPIKLFSQSIAVLGFHVPFTSLCILCKNAGPKPFCGAKQACFDFFFFQF